MTRRSVPVTRGDTVPSPAALTDPPSSDSAATESEPLSSILVIGGPAKTTREIVDRLRERGHGPRLALAVADGLEVLRREGADLVVLVLPFDRSRSRDALMQIRGMDAALPVIVVGSDADLANAGDAFDAGATDWVERGELNQLLASIGVAVGVRRQDEHLRYLRGRAAAEAGWDAIVGDCPAMQSVRRLVEQICFRTASGNAPPIRISGETGTGKGLLAKTLHYQSARRNQPFVDINCATIPKELMESELFGHERGAFTDARSSRTGLFETASGGTLFLDEIGSLPLDLQAKLLTAIEEKKIRRVGGRVPITVDVQVVCASHKNLQRLAAQGSFRPDLYHRLDVLAITLPPLRERGDDKLRLAQAFVASMCDQYGIPRRELSEGARRAITQYAWPGNVRELRNQIERIVLLGNDQAITAEDFQFGGEAASLDTIPPPAGPPSQRSGVASRSGRWRLQLPPAGFSLDDLERQAIVAALELNGGNVSKTARYLTISRQKLMYRMRRHGLS